MDFDKNKHCIDLGTRADNKESLNNMLLNLVRNGGSDLFLLGSETPRMSISGKYYNVSRRRLSETEIGAMLRLIYNDNAVSKINSGEPLNCAYEFMLDTSSDNQFAVDRFRFRVNAIACTRGGRNNLTVTMRSIPSIPPEWQKMGVEPELVDAVLNLNQGLIVIAGATGQGKSTLNASLLRARLEHSTIHTNLVTGEEPIEFTYDAIVKPNSIVTQVDIGFGAASFADFVENALRMAPTLILIGESRDYATVKASLNAAITGHGVLTTVHSNSAPEIIQRMINEYPAELQSGAKPQVIQPMSGLVSQRLVQKVGGGRIPIRELLFLDQNDKDKIIDSSNVTAAAFKLLNSGRGKPFIEDARLKYESGLISKDVYRSIEVEHKLVKAGHGL